MPIGAAIGTAVVGAGSAVIGARSQRRAADQAADVSRENTAANNALTREIYGENARRLDPYNQAGQRAGGVLSDLLLGPAGGNGAPTQGALDAFDRFRNSTNYQFRVGEGMDALGHLWATRGGLHSGAADRAAMTLGQNMGAQELASYMELLARQQGVGLGAAGALAGNGQAMVGAITANNNAAAQVAGNAAIARGNAQAGMWNGIGGAIGTAAGSIYQSSFAPGNQFPPPMPQPPLPMNPGGYTYTPGGGYTPI